MWRSAVYSWQMSAWRGGGFVVLLWAARRGARLVLAAAIIGALLWWMMAPAWRELMSDVVLPPEAASASLQLDREALRAVTASRQERAEREVPSFSQFSHLFVRSTAVPGEP